MVSAGFCHLLGEALRAMPQIRVGGEPGLVNAVCSMHLQLAACAKVARGLARLPRLPWLRLPPPCCSSRWPRFCAARATC